ncbi:uncharacterized protein C16orf95 homolog isoform X1 [Phascolarctos cinereus]|uniref:Uncharacterized protein C16orf95 homolog isoform X2 n=1 Tax=Phascolarctos cinereus TaxID=38626 RepID=A0A6P5KKA8_PHACI|nr:uncharacterized protein C16orf95 homolog isoform X2 [Phascolarctos cinereus]
MWTRQRGGLREECPSLLGGAQGEEQARMKPVLSRPKEPRNLDWNETNRSILWNKEPRNLKSEVKFIDFKDAPTHDSFYQVPACCQCSSEQLNFGGFLPVPRDEASLPYWVPRSLRPQKLVQRRVQFSFPQHARSCACSCHSFGGQLPVPRELAAFPYWVPRSVRFPGKANKNSSDFIWTKGSLCGGLSHFHHQWRVCCDEERLLRWQGIQARLPKPACQSRQEDEDEEGEAPSFLSLSFFLDSLYGLVMIVVSIIRSLTERPSSSRKELEERRAKEREKRKEERIRIMRILATAAGDWKREEEAKMEQLFHVDDELEYYGPEEINGTHTRSKKKASGMDSGRKESRRQEGLASGIQGVPSKCLPHFHGCWRICSEGSRLDMLLKLQSQFREEASKGPYLVYEQPDKERTLPVFVLGILLGSIRMVAAAMQCVAPASLGILLQALAVISGDPEPKGCSLLE